MSELKDFGALLKELQKVNDANASKVFTSLFRRGYSLFNFKAADAVRIFDASDRNLRRWKSGEKIPPAANLVLKFLREEVEREVRQDSKTAPAKKSRSDNVFKLLPPSAGRSHAKKSVPLGGVNPKYPTTCTTFWKQMEPALHSVMDAALKKTGVTSAAKSEYKGVTRRIYRAAVISAAAFLQKRTHASSQFLQKQGNEAVSKAVAKLFNSKTTDFDGETDFQ